jgi:hypothetical protein
MNILEHAGRLSRSWQDYKFDQLHKSQAHAALRTIEDFASRKLASRDRRQADEYSEQVLGGRQYAPWLYVYSLVRGEFRTGWIPDNYFARYVVPKVNSGLGVVTDFKTLTNRILRTDSLPDIAYYIGGHFYDRSLSPLRNEEFVALLRRDSHVFLKKDRSGRGLGVMRMKPTDIDADTFGQFGDCVIQRAICQHRFFDGIVAGSVATIRVTTVKQPTGNVDFRAAYLRLGRANTSWVQSDNSVRVAILSQDGDLDAYGYTESWRPWTAHPDTGFVFADTRIPFFEAMVAACLDLHRVVPHFGIVGWDVTLDRDEKVTLIEWNGEHCDIKFSEATTGPNFLGLGWENLHR